MTIGTNIPGVTSFYFNKQKEQKGGAPGTGAPPSPWTARTQPPQPSPMQGYVGAVAARPAATPAASPTPAPMAPYKSPLAGQWGSTLQDPGQITGAGQAYAQRVAQNMQPGQNPLITTAHNNEETAAARRTYMARRNTQDRLAQTPFALGSAQYQRAMDESQATVNSANQEGQNAVNAFTRQTSRDAMADANALEDQQYGRALGERTRTDLQGKDFATSLPEGKARYAYQAMIARGVSPQEAYQAVVGGTGEVNEQYKGQNPGQVEVRGAQQNAEAWVGATTDLKPGTKAYTEAVRKRLIETDQAVQAPLKTASKDAAIKEAQEIERTGGALSPEQQTLLVQSGTYKEYTPTSFPKDRKAVEGMVGQKVNFGGSSYTVTGYDKMTGTPILQDVQGSRKYVWGGKLQDRLPNAKGK